MVPFGQIADMIGRPRMAKFVGYTYKNKNYQNLPWHRRVFKDRPARAGTGPRIAPGGEAHRRLLHLGAYRRRSLTEDPLCGRGPRDRHLSYGDPPRNPLRCGRAYRQLGRLYPARSGGLGPDGLSGLRGGPSYAPPLGRLLPLRPVPLL